MPQRVFPVRVGLNSEARALPAGAALGGARRGVAGAGGRGAAPLLTWFLRGVRASAVVCAPTGWSMTAAGKRDNLRCEGAGARSGARRYARASNR
jgi:hypothetical protein